MAEHMDVHIISIPLANTATDWQADDVIAVLFRAPSAAFGGAITILEAYATNQAATGAGTSFDLTLLNYGTGGTAVSGTISNAIGGTASPWAAGVPINFTITDGKVEAGEYVVVSKNEVNSSDPTRCVVTIHYVMGV